MRGLGAAFLVRRARSSWLLLACVAVTVLVATGLAAALWTFAAGVLPAGALSTLTGPSGRLMAISGPVNASEAAADSKEIHASLTKAWPGVGFQAESALWSEPIQLPLPPFITTTIPAATLIQPASLTGVGSQATLTAGTWPGPPRVRGQLPVALPATVATRLHLTVGSVLTGAPELGGAPMSLLVTGLFRPDDPASSYWALDLIPVSGTSVQNTSLSLAGTVTKVSTTYGPAVVNPAAFDGTLGVTQGSWLEVPQAAAMSRENIGALTANTNAVVSQLTLLLPAGLRVTSELPQVLAGIVSTSLLTQSLFTIAALELLLVVGAGLVLAARLLASVREEESALLRARGATRWQLARPALTEALVVGAVASLAGVLAGTRLAGVLASLDNLRLYGYAGRGVTSLSLLSALVMLMLCVAVMGWPALRPTNPAAARSRRSRQARVAGIAWAGGDVALVVLAAIAVWQLRGYSAVAHQATGSLGIDPVIVVAPVLALAGLSLIPVRGLPLLARLADRTSDRGRRLATAMVSWQIARRPVRHAGPALLVVVATATATLGLAGYASWRQSAADQSAFSVGADVQADSAGALSPSGDEAISRAPGVTATTSASIASVGKGTELIALDANTAARTILLRDDLSPLGAGKLFGRITPARMPGLTLPGQPDRFELNASFAADPGSSTAQVRKVLSGANVTAWVQDSQGNTFQVSAELPFDGLRHSLVFTLTAPRQANYPLRLLGLTFGFVIPPYQPAHPAAAPVATLTVDSLAVSATAGGPFGSPFANGTALGTLTHTVSSPWAPVPPPGLYEIASPADGEGPSITSWGGTADGGQQLTFNTGHAPSTQVMSDYSLTPMEITGQIALVARRPSADVPVIATAGYLASSRLGIGSVLSVAIEGIPVTAKIVASAARFPTVYGKNQALVADLADVNDLLLSSGVPTLPTTRWWLSTAGANVPAFPAGLGLSVTSSAVQRAALIGNLLLSAPRRAMFAVGLAAVLLGVLGFSISIVSSLRSRRTQSAVFAALGVGKKAQAGQLCLEQCVLSLPASAAGLLAGIGLSEAMVPAITLTTGATAPVPSALVVVPLGQALALAFLTAAVPVAFAALSVLRRPDPAAQLRAETA